VPKSTPTINLSVDGAGSLTGDPPPAASVGDGPKAAVGEGAALLSEMEVFGGGRIGRLLLIANGKCKTFRAASIGVVNRIDYLARSFPEDQ
jgi:hypothetical protein